MLTLETLMTPAPVTITAEASLRQAVDLLAAMGVNALSVMAGNDIARASTRDLT